MSAVEKPKATTVLGKVQWTNAIIQITVLVVPLLIGLAVFSGNVREDMATLNGHMIAINQRFLSLEGRLERDETHLESRLDRIEERMRRVEQTTAVTQFHYQSRNDGT